MAKFPTTTGRGQLDFRPEKERERDPLSRLRRRVAVEGEVAVADGDLSGLSIVDLGFEDLLWRFVNSSAI